MPNSHFPDFASTGVSGKILILPDLGITGVSRKILILPGLGITGVSRKILILPDLGITGVSRITGVCFFYGRFLKNPVFSKQPKVIGSFGDPGRVYSTDEQVYCASLLSWFPVTINTMSLPMPRPAQGSVQDLVPEGAVILCLQQQVQESANAWKEPGQGGGGRVWAALVPKKGRCLETTNGGLRTPLGSKLYRAPAIRGSIIGTLNPKP